MKRMRWLVRIFRPRATTGPRRRRRTVLFHAGAAVVVLCPLVLVELVLRFFVPAPPGDLEDPYVSFSGLRPLFVLDATGARYEIAPERLAAFRPQSFAAVKQPGTFRVFCLGGSTVQGRPYSVETSFTTWLALNLRAARPETTWEVVNCGGISYASYRLVPILRELLTYEPDLFILYTGQNEFLEDREYGRLKRAPTALVRLHRAMLNVRTYALANQWFADRGAVKPPATVLPAEVRTKLDYEEALRAYKRDEVWRQGVIAHFRRNVEAMARLARQAGVPLILVNPASNLKDCPPFKPEFQADLSQADMRRIMGLWTKAEELGWSDVYGKIALLEQAVRIDERHAGLLYLLGNCYEHLGRFAEAKNWFVRAKEEDVCPLRILEPMHEVIVEVAGRKRVPLVDFKALVENRTADGIGGREWLLDHVHPTIEGHQLIADALHEAMEKMDVAPSLDGWRRHRDELWRRHLSSLNKAYYAQGAARLQRLRQWSRGHIPRDHRVQSGGTQSTGESAQK